jgi:hypothetical protein
LRLSVPDAGILSFSDLFPEREQPTKHIAIATEASRHIRLKKSESVGFMGLRLVLDI